MLSVGVVVCTVFTAGTQAERPDAGLRRAVSPPGMAPAPARQNTDEVTLALNEGGFEPGEITRPAGKFLLTVDNRSGVAEITLRLSREGGEHLRDIKPPKDAADWAEEFDLQTGAYLLTVVNHESWVCRLSIQ